MTPLLAFYYGSHPDNRGRFLAEIIGQDDFWLEVTHDYIQWLFPLTEYSRANPSAPILTSGDIKAFLDDDLLRVHLRAAFVRMLRFYGLAIVNGAITKAENWNDRKTNWFTAPTHNNLRITRILKNLTTLGLHEDAQAFLTALENLIATEPDCGVPFQSLTIWRSSIPTSTSDSRPGRRGLSS